MTHDIYQPPSPELTPEKRHQQLVRLSFNPSSDPRLDEIKRGFAAMMTLTEKYAKDQRAAAIAVTHLETACMYAVKAATA